MISATGLRWILTALFGLSALYALSLAAAPGRTVPRRVGHVFHVTMGAMMVAMAWPWGMDLPAEPQVAVFSAGALWFAVVAAQRPPGAGPRTAGLPAALPHILMMAAMAWMAAVMDGSAMASHGGGGAQHEGAHSSGAGAAGAMSLTGTGQRWAAAALAVVLVALGLVWLARSFDRARRTAVAAGRGTPVLPSGGAAEPACHAAMAIGMAVMFVLLL